MVISQSNTSTKVPHQLVESAGETVSASLSDSRLLEVVKVRLKRLAFVMQLDVEATVLRGIVTLSGVVANDYERQVVLQSVRQVTLLRGVRDQLRSEETVNAVGRGGMGGRISKFAATLMEWTEVRRRVWLGGAVTLAALVVAILCWGRGAKADNGLVDRSGMVTVGGKPAGGAYLELYRLDGKSSLRPRGTVAADGTIEWTTYQRGDGLLPGEYKVTAIWRPAVVVHGEYEAGRNLLPLALSQPETSPLRLVVAKSDPAPFLLELPR